MLKSITTAAVLAITMPAAAQVTPAPQQAPATAPPSSPATTPQQDTTAPAATPAPADQAAATPAAQPSGGDAVAQVVDTGWSTYDTNGDGKLSRAEFAEWMNKMKSATDAKFDPASAATKKWNAGAFAQADTDKSKAVSKAELTTFLSKGQKAS